MHWCRKETSFLKFLFQIFMRMGIPHVITTDQGSEFRNTLNREIAMLLGIQHRLTTAYHPQVLQMFYAFLSVVQSCNLFMYSFYILSCHICRLTVSMSGSIRHCRQCSQNTYKTKRITGMSILIHVFLPTIPHDMNQLHSLLLN